MILQKTFIGILLLLGLLFSCSPETESSAVDDMEEVDSSTDDEDTGDVMNEEEMTDDDQEDSEDDMMEEEDMEEEDDMMEEDSEITYTNTITAFFETYCVMCHGTERANGGVRLDTYDLAVMFIDRVGPSLGFGDTTLAAPMPPANATQPSQEEKDEVLEWIDGGLLE